MWLDLHSGFGLFGLPFHFAISLTAVVFCWQGQIERVQAAVFGAMPAAAEQGVVPLEHPHPEKMLTPEQLLAALARQAPGFQPSAMLYTRDDEGRTHVGPPIHFREEPASPSLRPPRLGEHTDALLGAQKTASGD